MLTEPYYRALLEDQTEVISRFLSDGTMVYANEVYCRFFGKTRESLIGQRWHPVAHPDDIPEIEARLAALSPSNPVSTVENRVFAADGKEYWMQFINRGFFSQTGQLLEVQSVGHDITGLKVAQAALSESRARVQALLLTHEQSREQQRQAIVRDIQEQLGPVLATISSQLADLQQQAGPDTPQKTALADVFAQVQHASQIAATLCSHLPPATSPFMQLSAREQEVMRGLIAGLSARSIAAQLGVSDKSIATYRRRILDKLGVDSNAALIAMAVNYGLL
jgi:PAS domain S-box-containing protein